MKPFLYTIIIIIIYWVTACQSQVLLSDAEKRSAPKYDDIPDASLLTKCDMDKYQKYSAVHRSKNDKKNYALEFNSMIEAIRNLSTTPEEICFSKKYFLVCESLTTTCKCATDGIWSVYEYKEVGTDCFVGPGGRCSTSPGHYTKCIKGTKCLFSGKIFKSKEREYVCSSQSTLRNVLLVPIALAFLAIWY